MELNINNLDDIDPNTLSKSQGKQYKKLKKQHEKEQARKYRDYEKKKKNIIKGAVVISIIIVFAVFLKIRSDSKQEFLLNAPSLELIPKVINLGTISAAKGPVEAVFTVKNKGDSNLKISNMVTSCMCTTASVIVNGKESPQFGMHNNPLSWSEEIPPGEAVELKVVFDPNFHANTRGAVTRYVSFSTNDPINKQAQVRIRTNVVA